MRCRCATRRRSVRPGGLDNQEFIKSGVYGENASAALTFTAGLIGLFGALILHTYFITQRRASIDFRTRETIKDLERKIKSWKMKT